MLLSVVTEKGQVVIPAPLRKKFNIKKGSKVYMEEGNEGEIVIHPLPNDPIEKTRGILRGKKSLIKVLLDERKKDKIRE